MHSLTDFVVTAFPFSDDTELFAESPNSAEEAALCLTNLKDNSSGPNSCYFCKRSSGALIHFGSFHSCKPCMKKATMKSDLANASFPFIQQDKIYSKVRSEDNESPASIDKTEGNDSDGEKSSGMDVDVEEAEGNDSDGEDASVDDVDVEEAEGHDSDGEKSSVDDVDAEEAEGNDSDGGGSPVDDDDDEEAGDDVEEGISSGRDAAPTAQEAFKELLATIATRPQSFEAMSVFQETIKYTIYQPFDTMLQPFDAGKTKHYVSPLVCFDNFCANYIF